METTSLTYQQRQNCRACGRELRDTIVALGDIKVSNFADKYLFCSPGLPVEPISITPVVSAPIELMFCDECYLVQNRHTVNRSTLYSNYWYKSGINKTMLSHLKSIADHAKESVQLEDGDLIIDIASNDGTLLRSYAFSPQQYNLVGFDPALNLAAEASVGVTHHISDYFSVASFDKHFNSSKKAKIITACAVIYHLDNPKDFFLDVCSLLHPEGVFICEFSYLPSILKNTAIDSLGHEHLEHYSLISLEPLLHECGLQIREAQLGDINSGTIRLTCCHIDRSYGSSRFDRSWLSAIRYYERCLCLQNMQPYRQFVQRANKIREDLLDFLFDLKKEGKIVYAYGASTKGSVLLQWCDIGADLVPKVVEKNPHKIGKLWTSTGLEVISEEEMRSNAPDYLLVLPWHFKKEFIEREQDLIELGTKMVFPLPEISIHY